MDSLHGMLSAIRTETKSQNRHLTVFREFLAHLDQIQRKAPAAPRAKPQPRRKPKRQARAG